MARKSRATIQNTTSVLIEPFDITKFGSEEDPCFGKLNDPKAPECKICGDFEFCAIVTAENLKKVRAKEESKSQFKDLDTTPEIEEIRQFMRKKLEIYSGVRVIRLAIKKFDISKAKAKTIIKDLI
jgi:hypothetical protein